MNIIETTDGTLLYGILWRIEEIETYKENNTINDKSINSDKQQWIINEMD